MKSFPFRRFVVAAVAVAAGLSAWADTEVSDFDSLTNAIATVEEDSVIVVTASIDLPATLVVDRKVTVRGDVTDPAAIIFNAGGNKRAVKITAAATVEGLTVKNGYVEGSNETGAGVQMTAGTLRDCIVSDCGFPSGKGQGTRGGGVYLSGASTLVENCEITRNYGDLQTCGSGICNNGGTVRNCLIHSNTHKRAITNGVGLYQSGAAALTENCVISNNVHSGVWGGNQRVAGAQINGGTVRGTVFADNRVSVSGSTDGANSVAGVLLESATLVNCTIVGNSSDNNSANSCAGVFVSKASAVVENCIIYDNYNTVKDPLDKRAADDVLLKVDGSTWTCNFLKDPSLVPGDTNKELLVSPFKSGGYELEDGVPCIAQGQVEDWMAEATDMKGTPRLRTAGGKTVVDVGAYAYEQPDIVVLISSDDPLMQFDEMNVTITSEVSGETDGLHYYWDVDGDGAAELDGKDLFEITFAPTDFGDYPVTLYVTNDVGKAAHSKSLAFQFRPSVMHVNPASANPQWPYATEETAAHSFYDVFNADNLVDGLTVRLHRTGASEPTVVALEETLVVDRPVTILGDDDDPAGVVLDAGGNKRAVKIDNGGTVRGLTIKNGYLSGGSQKGVGVLIANGLLKNCIVSDCSVPNSTANMGVGIYLDGALATVEGCEVTRNTGDLQTKGTGVYNSNGKVLRTVIHGNLNRSTRAITSGLGLFQTGSAAVTDGCIISNNVHVGQWGTDGRVCGAYVESGSVRSTLFLRNALTPTGGGASGSVAALKVTGSARIENCTFAENYSTGAADCGGVWVAASGAVVENCIFYDNYNTKADPYDPRKADDVSASGNKGTWTRNVLRNHDTVVPGDDNFEISAAPFREGTYEPADETAGIAQGKVETWMADAKDLKGNDRLRTVDGGTVVDAGAYAYEPPDLFAVISSESEPVQFDRFDLTVTSLVSGEIDGLIYYWDINEDGVAEYSGADLSTLRIQTETDFGAYDVRLYVTNGVGKAAKSQRLDFKFMTRTMHVDPSCTTPVWPYATAATAATNLNDAIAEGNILDGTTVVVHRVSGEAGPTVLGLRATLDIDKEIVLRGETGDPKDIVIDAGGDKRAMKVTGGALVEGLTIRRGYLPSAQQTRPAEERFGCGVYLTSGTLRRCIVADCTVAQSQNMGGIGVYLGGDRALVEDCEIRGNKADLQGYGAGVYNNGGTLRRSVIQGNTDTSGRGIDYGVGLYQNGGKSVTELCVISNNHVTAHWYNDGERTAGVQIEGGVLRSSLITGNTFESTANGSSVCAAAVKVVGNATVINCTVVSNVSKCTSANVCAGVCTAHASAKVKNCIIWDNFRPSGTVANWKGNGDSDSCFTYCCTTPALSDTHSTDKDPQFKNPELLDGVISAFSPCARTGVYDAAALGDAPLDLYGEKLRTPGGKLPMGCVSVPSPGLILMVR